MLASPWHQWICTYFGVALECQWPIWEALYWNTRYFPCAEDVDKMFTWTHAQIGVFDWTERTANHVRQAFVYSTVPTQHMHLYGHGGDDPKVDVKFEAGCSRIEGGDYHQLYLQVFDGLIVLSKYVNLNPTLLFAGPLAHDIYPQLVRAVALLTAK